MQYLFLISLSLFHFYFASFTHSLRHISNVPSNKSTINSNHLNKHQPRSLSSTISTPTGTYRGKTLLRIEQFLGLPFAQPPVGPLRWSKPVALVRNWNKTVVDAIAYNARCVQDTSSAIHEDCLHLNIFRPQGTLSTAKLPVMVWIFGGSFISGDSSGYNPTQLLLRSVVINRPVVYVSIDYRLGALGFLVSDQLRETGALNLGLQDQRMAFAWIKQNIQYFGGDPTKITAFGESAGAVSVSLHMLAYGGANPIFRGAIMESGAPQTGFGFTGTSSYPASLPYTQEQKYSIILNSTGCVASTNELACLKNASLKSIRSGQTRIRAAGGFPYAPVIDGLIIPAIPSHQFQAGKFAQIPFITGNNLDEATQFISRPAYTSINMSSSSQLLNWVQAQTPLASSDQVLKFLSNYPDIQATGSPYNTGPVKFLWKEYKRACSVFNDLVFHAPRRSLLLSANIVHPSTPIWSYLFTEPPPISAPPYLGVYHGTEIDWVYGEANQTTSAQVSLEHYMIDAWVNFAYYLNPNGITKNETWPAYTQVNLALMQFRSGNTTVIKDNFRNGGISYIINNPLIFGQ